MIELADRRLQPVPLPQQSVDEWSELARQNRVEFKQVEAGLNARRALVEDLMPWAEAVPLWELRFKAGFEGFGQVLEALEAVLEGSD